MTNSENGIPNTDAIRNLACGMMAVNTTLTASEKDVFNAELDEVLNGLDEIVEDEVLPIYDALAPLLENCEPSSGPCVNTDNITETIVDNLGTTGLKASDEIFSFQKESYMTESTMQTLWNSFGGGTNARIVNGKAVSFTPSNGDVEASLRFGDGECNSLINVVNSEVINKMLNELNAIIDCPLEDWASLASHQPNSMVLNRLNSLSSTIFGANGAPISLASAIQSLSDAKGAAVNLDYFPVEIQALPTGMTKESLFNHFRLYINNFINTAYSTFNPHPTLPGEASKWVNDPLGTIVYIEIPGDDGTVICTDYDETSWTFSTIFDARISLGHPVSGHREFGISENEDGSYSLYTRGVDRLTGVQDELFSSLIKNIMAGINVTYYTALNPTEVQFSMADRLWRSMQKGLVEYINFHGGSASIGQERTLRPNWDSVREYLLGISENIDCND